MKMMPQSLNHHPPEVTLLLKGEGYSTNYDLLAADVWYLGALMMKLFYPEKNILNYNTLENTDMMGLLIHDMLNPNHKARITMK